MADLCPRCGTPFADDDNYCRKCRQPRKADKTASGGGPRPLTVVLIVLLAAACIVIGVLAGTLIAVPQGGDDNQYAGQTVTPTPTPTEDPTDVATPTPDDTNSFAPTSKDQYLNPPVSTPVETPTTPSEPTQVITPTVPEVVSYYVTFYTSGFVATPAQQRVLEGETAVEPWIESRDGYKFEGWFTSNGARYVFSTPVYGDMVLTARWSAIPGTKVNPIVIFTAEELVQMDAGTYYRLGSNIDLSAYPSFPYQTYYLDMGGYQVTFNDMSPVVTPSTPAEPTPESSVIEIRTTSEFLQIYNNPSGKYKLMADITIPAGAIPEGSVFTGVLDGNGHTLVADGGNTILIPTTKFVTPRYYGLFGQNHGVIKDLTLSGFVVNMKDKQHNGAFAYTGTVCGLNKGTISDVHVISSKLTVLRMGASGFICGDNQGTIEDSSVTRGVLQARGDGGGICGHNNGIIRDCSVTGNGQGTSKEYEKYRFLFFDRGETGENGKKVQSWGGVCGYASSSSRISSTSVDQMHLYCFFRSSVEANIGYFVGLNEGFIGDDCVLGAVEQKRNGDYSSNTVRYYLEGYYYGKNTGVIPASW